LERVDWNNSRLVTTNVQDEVLKLKSEPGKDIALLGSGNPLFQGIMARIRMKLIAVKTFGSGVVLLSYKVG
jgi:hypothetical protein